MIKRFILIALWSVLGLFRVQAQGTDGMWLLSLVNENNADQMQQMGCQLNGDQIYNPGAPSMKDAICWFGGFCTGEIVSNNGLILTNHHCGYDAVAGVSTPEKNLLDDGFFAKSHDEEIPIPGLWIKILVRMENVTDSIFPIVNPISDPTERLKKANELRKLISAHAKTATGMDAEVTSMYYGNQYYLFIYQTFNDIRLVGTPPQSIGKFGGDTDNWMWPRHTGDFSMFRVYSGTDNNPAAYSAANIPYKPKFYLTVSTAGYEEGDFTMIMGFPGQTQRYLTSYAMEEIMNNSNPAYVDIFGAVTSAMKSEMDKDVAVRLKLSSDYASLMNTFKLFDSQIAGMKTMDIVGQKKKNEDAFVSWLGKQNTAAQEKYGTLMKDYESVYGSLKTIQKPFLYTALTVNLMASGQLAVSLNQLDMLLNDKKSSADDKKVLIEELKAGADETFGNYFELTEPKKLLNVLVVLDQKLSGNDRPAMLDKILAGYSGMDHAAAFKMWVDKVFSVSVLSSKEKFLAFLNKPSAKTLVKDELYQLYLAMFMQSQSYRQFTGKYFQTIGKLTRLYIQGLWEMNPDKAYAPDANFSERLTYGVVKSYDPKDAVHYVYETYFTGVIQKMDNTSEEFTVPAKLYQLYQAKDFGPYADKTGDIPVCFLSTCDITGGNSGSPIMNNKGQLIGLAFDGNYEGTPGDYAIDPNMNRTISVDIRYVLFIIDKFGGATNLINEMTIVK